MVFALWRKLLCCLTILQPSLVVTMPNFLRIWVLLAGHRPGSGTVTSVCVRHTLGTDNASISLSKQNSVLLYSEKNHLFLLWCWCGVCLFVCFSCRKDKVIGKRKHKLYELEMWSEQPRLLHLLSTRRNRTLLPLTEDSLSVSSQSQMLLHIVAFCLTAVEIAE